MSDRVNDFRRERFLRFLDPTYGLPDTDDLPRADMSFTEAYNAVAEAEPDLSVESVVSDAVDAWHERLEKELFGAWRAGYEYLHIYRDAPQPLGQRSLADTSVLGGRYVVPSHSHRPLLRDERDFQYEHTYNLTEIPDHIMRAAWNDDLEKYERLDPADDEEVDFV